MENETQNTQEYFTKEVQDSIANMTKGEMSTLLRDLETTPYWIALLKYTQERLRMMESTILYSDPVKEPTLISRSQGIMLGLSDLQNAVITLIQSDKQQETK